MRRILRVVPAVALAGLFFAPVAAQDTPPEENTPPASELEGQPLPGGHPPVEGGAAGELPQGHPPVEAAGPHGAGAVANVLAPPQLGRAEENPELPAGTIRVTVVDVNGRPIADSPVDIGLRSQTEERARHNARTEIGRAHV